MSTTVGAAHASVAVVAEKPSAAEEPMAGPSFTAPITVTSVDESKYAEQLETKLGKLRQLFAEFDPPELEVFESPASHYRMRAEFSVDTRDGELHYVMYDKSPEEGEQQEQQEQPESASGAAAAGDGAAAGPEAEASTSAPSGAAAAPAGGKPASKKQAGKKRPRGPRRVRVESFPVASRQLNELMAAVRQEANRNPELRERLFQVNFHTTLAGDAMVTLVYHRKLGQEWNAAAEALRSALAATPAAAAAGKRPHVIGRSRKQKVELDASHVEEVLCVGGRRYTQRQVEGAFSQPNAAVCQAMLSWALDVTRPTAVAAEATAAEEVATAPAPVAAETAPQEAVAEPQQAAEAGEPAAAGTEAAAAAAAEPTAVERAAAAASPGVTANGDLLELYCGNGNFTVPLAQNFRFVLATEVAKSSVEAARHNLASNGVANVFIARMASEEFAETMRARGSRRRLEGLGPWEALALRTVLVDPPRAGLDDFTVELLKEFDRIVYISCNPETLHANLRSLAPTHRVARFAAFDQFPYTHHLEAGVYLVRR